MSTLISGATGNFTTAGTWALVDATSYLDSEAGSTASTTSLVYSSTFTPGAITVDGVAVKVASRTASPSGTVTVGLYLNAGNVLVDSATLNATDIANTNSGVAYNRGWYFFKFAAPQLLSAATAYKVGFVTSSSGTVTLYRDATAGNWSRMLRTTTTQAPAAGDQLHIIGEHTGAGTGNSFTVTMDNTATTSFGPTVSGGPPQGVTVGKRGTFTCGTSIAAYLRWKGVFGVMDAGTLNIGTSGTPVASGSSAIFEMDSVANVDTGFDFGHGSTVNVYGFAAFITSFKTLLNTDEAAASTVLGVVATTGWANGDEICIASTTQTFSQCEKRTISTVDSGTQVTVSAGLTNAHSGTSPTQAEVGNLTRNVKIRGIGTNQPSTTTTLQGYINVAATAVVNVQYAQFYYLGSGTAGKRGFDIATTTGTFNFQYCSVYDGWITNSLGANISSASGSGITLSNNVFFNLNSYQFGNVPTSGVQTVQNNLFMLNVISNPLMIISDVGGVMSGNTACGGVNLGFSLSEIGGAINVFDSNTSHSNASGGGSFTGVFGTASGLTVWRNGNSTVGGIALLNCHELTLLNAVLFGNLSSNITLSAITYGAFNCYITNMVSNGDTTFPTTSGIRFFLGGGGNIIFEGCDFSTVSGIKTVHTNDILFSTANTASQLILRNCKLGGTSQVTTPSNLTPGSFVAAQRLGQTAGNHKTWMTAGTVALDTTIFRTALPSSRLTPTSASVKLQSAPQRYSFKKRVDNGATISASIYVRQSLISSGDAATYNGNFARLIVRKNVAAGISDDTVLATATSASSGAFELLTGTTAAVTDDAVLEFFVDGDGTVGWLNIDDFS